MSDVEAACTSAKFVCSAAVNTREFPAFVLEQENVNVRQGSGVDEFRKILRRRRDASCGELVFAQWNMDLYQHSDPFPLDVWSLSPSTTGVASCIARMAQRAQGLAPARRAMEVGANEGSVALWVRAGSARILLGADLEEPGQSDRGWSAVIDGRPNRWLENGSASAFKVSHHGSADARHERIWTELLEAEPLAVVAPYQRGANPPPTSAERRWIHDRTTIAFTTIARLSDGRRKRGKEIERQLRGVDKRLVVRRSFGHIRARTSGIERSTWEVETFGDAGPLPI
jgi:hypothetical protein